MTLSRSMIRLLVSLAEGASGLSELAKKTGLSQSRCSQLCSQLEKLHLVARRREGMKTRLRLADSPPAASFKEMYFGRQHTPFADFLYGLKLDLLQLLIFEPKSVATLAKLTGSSKPSVWRSLKALRSRSLVWKEKEKYRFTTKAYPSITKFLYNLRTFTPENKLIVWKFNGEEIFHTRNEALATQLTGLNRYKDFGVEVFTIDALCVSPPRTLAKEEIFVHSLLEIGDEPRVLAVAIAFYLKNAVKDSKLSFPLEKYDLTAKFAEFKKTVDAFIKNHNAQITNSLLPSITGEHIARTLGVYQVKDV